MAETMRPMRERAADGARKYLRAVNCHADLVAALEACRLALDDNKPMSTAKMWELGAVVRAALAKAQGRKRND